MRLAISNIAWDIAEDASVAKLLGKFGVDAIDVAPGKYFPEPANAKDEDIANVRRWWAGHGIEITGMQALLFGTTGLNVFGDSKIQQAMLEHLRAVCRIGAGLGATRLVFGSPKNRDRSGLSDAQALEQAVSFFRRLGDVAQEYDAIVCLEPNPTQYGANFMTTSEETAYVVAAVDHEAIRMQFDTGALTINGESPEAVLERSSRFIGHVHASEPDLVPLGDGGTDHQLIHKALSRHLPEHLVTIEMVATKEEPHLQSIERALVCAVECYWTKHTGWPDEMVDLGARYRRKCLCQRTGQDGHNTPEEASLLCRSVGSLEQLALLARLRSIRCSFPALCRCTGQVALECSPPGIDIRGDSNGRAFFCYVLP